MHSIARLVRLIISILVIASLIIGSAQVSKSQNAIQLDYGFKSTQIRGRTSGKM